ncbi:MAG: GIY-YIG nuclease family protein [Chthoniobacteraceae bacterium]
MSDESMDVLTDEQINAIADQAVLRLPCVYVLGTPLGYKIGYATNLEQRLRELQTGCPAPLVTEAMISTHAPAKLESCLHRRFNSKRKQGEWFDLSSEDLAFLRGIDAKQIRELLHDDDIPF